MAGGDRSRLMAERLSRWVTTSRGVVGRHFDAVAQSAWQPTHPVPLRTVAAPPRGGQSHRARMPKNAVSLNRRRPSWNALLRASEQ